MLQNKFEKPLDLTLKPSNILYGYFVIIFVCALVSIFITDSLPLTNRIIIFLLLLVSFIPLAGKYYRINITHLLLNKESEWEVITRNNERFEVALCGECIVTYFLVWLNFTTNNSNGKKKTFHVLLLPDSSDKEQLRQLRVRLRFLETSNKISPVE